MIIVGFPGVGKTSYLKENPNKAYDLDSGFFKYKGPYEYIFDSLSPNINKIDIEKVSQKILKAYDIFKDKSTQAIDFWEINSNWKEFYSKAIEKFEIEGNRPYILVPLLEKETFKYLKDKNIDMLYVYPSLKCKEDFMNRYANRNDGRKIEIFQNEYIFTQQILYLEKNIPNNKKIVLNKGEFLSNIIEKLERKVL